MKQLLLLCFFALAFVATPLFAQDCEPDPIYQDSMPGPYPMPYDMETMMGGITDTGCVGNYFEFPMTIVIPDEININGFLVSMDSLIIVSVENLPPGISYKCNPENCHLLANTLGCVLLYGTPEEAGTFDLVISGDVYILGGTQPQPLTFPGLIAPGNYFLAIDDPEQGECIVGTENVLPNYVQIKNRPNPFSYETQIELQAKKASEMVFNVFDMLGNIVHSETVQVQEGRNLVPFNGSDLSNGIYLYSFSNEDGTITQKMVVSR